jgi:Cft2 family RNA processing exonuclease
MNGKTLSLTQNFVCNAGQLVELGGPASDAPHFKSVSCSQTQIAVQADDSHMSANIQSYSYSSVEGSAPSKSDACGICIVPISDLSSFGPDTKKYVLTCRLDYPFESIRLSDHLDVDGLTQMVKNISPKMTVVYHPDKSQRADRFAKHLEKNGFKALSINQIQAFAGEKNIKSA